MTLHPLRRALLWLTLALTAPALAAAPLDLETATVTQLEAAMADGALTSETLVRAYLARIAAYDKQGPTINAVIALNPKALREARRLDRERKAGHVRGPLHGIPVVLKDNIDTFDLPTTAGSSLLAGSLPPDDAFIVKRLRAAGAIVLAKVNLSEFAAGGGSVGGSRDPAVLKAGAVPNGYSSMGGQTRNPHALDYGPSGSSGGTGAAIAAAFAQFGLGTDTRSSVRGPSSVNGIVGLKPTNGLLSRDGIVPLALSLDTAGPMARSVADIAVALNVMAGVDPDDAMTSRSQGHVERDYAASLRQGALKGARIGIARDFGGRDAGVDAVFEQAVQALRGLGAETVDFHYPRYLLDAKDDLYFTITQSEFKAQIADYLKTTAPRYPKSLDDLARLASDPRTGYPSPQKAYGFRYTNTVALALDDPVYLTARQQGMALVKASLDAMLEKYRLDAIVYLSVPTAASPIQPPANPQPVKPGDTAFDLANLSGYPDLVVPAGMTPNGLPVTVSFLGPAFSEARLLGYGYDFEQATRARRLPRYTPMLASDIVVP
ncbi:glutamyl-tRNA amidotransferase [Pseudoxanthomonas winnipegensis]|jgi:amidase|uniref:Glutamyl-tRNA amidotransferase n=1 Tax=Pseudoxanthomonas winnipegensis TaxID=2480810 RepID=A0ABY1WEF4_9GAMM|nr:amidase family protein [Pseudoxanthomonas winnipegensis]TAA11881.1 glutamyl-tRNA amidotransferase [Pseudoxanthomonas winnipegensis]TAA19757.1 glutamyl-tRNA amidotransferase [Pseudoxanthomonas winnipegensis]TAH70736.1 glutamyl-tRNA amidotransferase [Pseudoxanthomonas winnipegensis]